MMDFPRVTEILRPYSGMDYVPKDILERAAARGTTVHSLCAGLAKGNWIPDSMIEVELQGYVNSFKLWATVNVEEYVLIEKRFVNEMMEYTGQVDYVIKSKADKGKIYLVDIKTGTTKHKTHRLQMAAYEWLLGNHNYIVDAALLVYLDKDGGDAEVHFLSELSEEVDVFLAALECWKYFNKGKKNGRSASEAERLPENISNNGRA